MVCGKKRANNKTSFFIFWNSWLGWVGLGWVGWDGLGWVGFVGGAGLFFRYVCPFLHSQVGDGLRKKKSQ